MFAVLKSITMFSLCMILLAMTCALGPQEGEKQKKAKVGEKAPGFTLKDCGGKTRSLSDYEGKLVILEWTDHECHFVQRHYRSKSMEATYKEIKKLDESAVWIAVDSTYSSTAMKNKFWIDRYKIDYPILLDSFGEVARLYDARMTPHMFVIDKKGVLR